MPEPPAATTATAAPPAAPPASSDSTPPAKRAKLRAPRIHPRWHGVLLAYQWVFGFVGLGTLGIVVGTLLQSGFSNFFNNVRTPLAALFAFVTTYKLATVPLATLLLVLFVISLIAGRQRAQDTATAADAHVVEVAKTTAAEAATVVVDDRVNKLEAAAAAAAEATVRPMPVGVLSPDGLPRASHLFGRDTRLGEVLTSLQAGEALNVSALVGQPGIGKTALAAETVAVALERGLFPGGALWLSCRDRHGPDGLAYLWSEIARQLGVDDKKQPPTAEQQRSRLRTLFADITEPKALLVFDNIELDLDADAWLIPLQVAAPLCSSPRAKPFPRRASTPSRSRSWHPTPPPHSSARNCARATPSGPTTPMSRCSPTSSRGSLVCRWPSN